MDLIRMVCGDIDEMSTTSNVIETLAMVRAPIVAVVLLIMFIKIVPTEPCVGGPGPGR